MPLESEIYNQLSGLLYKETSLDDDTIDRVSKALSKNILVKKG